MFLACRSGGRGEREAEGGKSPPRRGTGLAELAGKKGRRAPVTGAAAAAVAAAAVSAEPEGGGGHSGAAAAVSLPKPVAPA